MDSKRFDIVTIGNAIIDIVQRCDEAFIASTCLPKSHMTLAPDAASIEILLKRLPAGYEVAGGSAANTAVGIASFGGKSVFIGKAADDRYGRALRHDLRGVGVSFDTAPALAVGKVTARSLILTGPDGQRTMYTYLGCSPELDASALDPAIIGASRIVYLEGYLFDRDTAKAAFRTACTVASRSGTATALSLSDSLCVERHREDFLRLIRSGVSILIANESEIAALYGTPLFEYAVRQASIDVPIAIITRGPRGSVIASKSGIVEVPAEPVKRPKDVTGAGDMYAAGVLYGIAHGMSHGSAGRLGSFAAAEIISTVGARPEVRLGQLAHLRGLLS